MDLTTEAINRILELAPTEVTEIDGRKFTARPVCEVKKHMVDTITVHSLQAVADFFDGGPISPDQAMIHVVNPKTVHVMDRFPDQTYRTREHFLTASRIHTEFQFGHWFEQEEMVINLMTMFEQTELLKSVIKVVSGLILSQEAEVNDDGVSQEVKVRKGIGRVENVTIENPILLQPIRSFTEIEQPSAPYVLRIKDRGGVPHIAIFEAGGGHWKNVAIESIKAWLKASLGEASIIG